MREATSQPARRPWSACGPLSKHGLHVSAEVRAGRRGTGTPHPLWVGGLWLTEPTERESISHRVAGLGHRQTQGKNKPVVPPSAKCYCTESGKFKRSQEYLLLFPSPHTLTWKQKERDVKTATEVRKYQGSLLLGLNDAIILYLNNGENSSKNSTCCK